MKSLTSLAAIAACCFGLSAQAANFSFTGNFANDGDVALFDVTVNDPGNVLLRSYSYAGGTQANGTEV